MGCFKEVCALRHVVFNAINQFPLFIEVDESNVVGIDGGGGSGGGDGGSGGNVDGW